MSRSGIAHIAAAALEDALRERDITNGHEPLTLRSDNGLVFGAKVFVSVVRRYGLEQEYITPFCEVARPVNALRKRHAVVLLILLFALSHGTEVPAHAWVRFGR